MGSSDARSGKTSRARDLQLLSRLTINHARTAYWTFRLARMNIARWKSYQMCTKPLAFHVSVLYPEQLSHPWATCKLEHVTAHDI